MWYRQKVKKFTIPQTKTTYTYHKNNKKGFPYYVPMSTTIFLLV